MRLAEPHERYHRMYVMSPMKKILASAVASCAALLATTASYAEARSHLYLGSLEPQVSDYDNGAVAPENASFGAAVAVQGSTALVGMPGSSLSPGNVLEAGRVGVFTYSNNQWRRTGTLFASKPTSGANFGRSVVLQNDTALIGSNATLYVFRRVNGTWRQIQQVKAPSSDGVTQFPGALAIYSDTAVVSASAGQEGLVYVYQLQSDGTLKWAARVRSPTADPAGSCRAPWWRNPSPPY